ncbi:MAG TPA: acyltransferase family protein, partial [Polyangiaceae bacterium]|nr:acyltransferase family protein [Polyangiaceae bacterium]
MKTAGERLPEVDLLKGFCILCVVAIHARLLGGTAVFYFVIDRAVPIFLVLFGVTSELWWRRNSGQASGVTRRWYVGRLVRVLPGYWALMASWWLVVALWQRPDNNLVLGWPQLVISFLGSAGWVATTWFVTIILQYIAIMPWLRRAPGGRWAAVVLSVAALSTFLSAVFLLGVIHLSEALFGKNVQELYYFWISLPHVLWHVMAGIFIARWWQGKVPLPATGIAIAVAVAGAVAASFGRPEASDITGRLLLVACMHLLDVPLALALLGLFRWTPLPDVARRGL